MSAAMQPTCCAICGTFDNASEVYPSTVSGDDLNPRVFSARRTPDRVHYRMVRCRTCGLMRSDPVASSDLAALYANSTFDYAQETPALKKTYGRYLSRMFRHGRPQSLLEIGAGNGFFLEEALGRGIPRVQGVEPSADAVAKARPDIRPAIVVGLMKPGLFAPGSFDAACMFQVLDHLPSPNEVLGEVHKVLSTGGLLLLLNHNAEAWSAKLLRESSPIIDVEHTYLYGPATMAAIVAKNGFDVLEQGPVVNRSSVGYVLHLLPLGKQMKERIRRWAAVLGIDRVPLMLPFGNLYLIARKR
jgi:SAM-dependent methyltransferase